MEYWGYHLMLDCSKCNDGIKSRENIISFVKDLVDQIEMVSHGEPVVEYLLAGEPNQGYSLMQLITTSNICGHFIEPNYTAYFDIFSCKKFDIEVAKAVVRQYFGAEEMKVNFICRQA